MTCGGNRDDFHLTGVTPERDYQAEYCDLRLVQQGEPCIHCGNPLTVNKALEIGHIFKLGTKYSESMGATVLDTEGKQVPLVMGSYGIGLERIMAAAIELYHDKDGIQWPVSIAPFQCVISLLSVKDQALVEAAERAVQDLEASGIEVLLDDRDERPGVKFKDADLVGIPYRVNFGSKKFSHGLVEWVCRSDRSVEEIVYSELASHALRAIRQVRI
jgi:prolyl-tRNA synthetase